MQPTENAGTADIRTLCTSSLPNWTIQPVARGGGKDRAKSLSCSLGFARAQAERTFPQVLQVVGRC